MPHLDVEFEYYTLACHCCAANAAQQLAKKEPPQYALVMYTTYPSMCRQGSLFCGFPEERYWRSLL